MQPKDYVKKLETMIQENIAKGKYTETEDNTLKDLKTFQKFFWPVISNQHCLVVRLNRVLTNMPSCMGLPKLTSSTDNPGEIPKANAKLQPIVSTCSTFYYETVKYLAS